ncbi:MAG TPA: 4a-hydroxytetrahydrobiopterin dehydratase, partial [Candidatus Hydrogenedentes bacterium]|nr:4a-hydroxytetrahydrobiopterin dehydratase [Candidatus Hydrogenedentota bacterium]
RPLSREEAESLLKTLSGKWELSEQADRIRLSIKVENFSEALALVNRIGAAAETLDHHPDISFGWGWVKIVLWTHKVNGLTQADFALAREVERCCGIAERAG